MPSNKDFEVKGLAELQRRLGALPEKIERKVAREAARAGAEVLREEASLRAIRAPSPTHPEIGHLADNIRVSVAKTKEGYSAKTRTGKAYWGLYLEYGTQKMRRFPFMRPAFDSKGDQMVEALADELGRGIEREA